jgi:hypothetical protein
MEPMPSGTYVGVSGTAIKRLTAKPNVLITKIEFSPYASCSTLYSRYSDTHFTKQNSSGGKYGSFDAKRAGSYRYGLMGAGNTFTATMVLSDGSSIIVGADGKGSFDGGGWRSVNKDSVKQKLSFNFSSKLKGKPLGITTNYITFETSGSSGTFTLLVVNGLVCYKN